MANLTDLEKSALYSHYTEMKMELSSDTKQLSEQSLIKALQSKKASLERKFKKIQDDNRALDKRFVDEKHALEKVITESKELHAELRTLNDFEIKDDKE